MQNHLPGIWIVAANHRQARLFSAATESAPLVEAETIANPDADASESELHRHDPGHSMHGSSRRTILEPQHSGRRMADEAFASSIAKRIETLRVSGSLQRLHVVAEPRMMGLLRQALGKDVNRLVESETSRDPGHDDLGALRAALPNSL